jgi:hypothetical protein
MPNHRTPAPAPALALALAVLLAALLLTSCSSDQSKVAVAKLGPYTITKSLLNQWMIEKAADDFYEVATHPAPPHLVSEPANYPACIDTLEKITPTPGHPNTTELTQKCHELYESIKTQTLQFLLSSYWELNFFAHHGIDVTNQETQQTFEKIKKESYPTKKALQTLLQNRGRTLTQELFIVKNDALQQRTEQLLHHNKQQATQILNEAKTQQNTATCKPQYTANHCTNYKPPTNKYPTTSTSAPSVLMEEIARWNPETSHGFTGQPVQPN